MEKSKKTFQISAAVLQSDGCLQVATERNNHLEHGDEGHQITPSYGLKGTMMRQQRKRQQQRSSSLGRLTLFGLALFFCCCWTRREIEILRGVNGWSSSSSSYSSSPSLRGEIVGTGGILLLHLTRSGSHSRTSSGLFALLPDASSTRDVDPLSPPLPSPSVQAPQLLDDYLSSHHHDDDLTIASVNADLQQIALENPLRAQLILEQLEDKAGRYQSLGLVPNSASYHCVIDGWCHHHHHHNNQHFKTNSDEDGHDDGSGDFTMTKPLDAAEQLLERMEKMTSRSQNMSPNPLSYLEVCEKWTTVRPLSVSNMERAESILDRYINQMMATMNGEKKQSKRDDSIRHQSTRNRFNHTHTHTHASSHHPLYSPGNLLRMYIIVIEGWCRLVEKVPETIDRIEELLRQIESNNVISRRREQQTKTPKRLGKEHRDENDYIMQIRPNVVVYTTVITALSRMTTLPNMAQRADALLQRMKDNDVQPDLVAYTSVLSCWSRTTSKVERNMASKRALDLLDEIEDLYLQRHLAKPSPITYGTAIMAVARSFDKRAHVIAETVLRRMYNHNEMGTIAVSPTTSCWNAVIYAMGSNRKAEEAETLLLEMVGRSRLGGESTVPNIKTWGNVIRAYAQSGRSDAGVQANRVLTMLEAEYDSRREDESDNEIDSIKPNYVCYTAVLQAWARGKAPQDVTIQKVDGILQKMEEEFQRTGDESIRPNGVTYTIAMDAYCRHDPVNAGVLSQKLVDRMVKLFGKGVGFERPSLMVMNTLINSWAQSQHPLGTQNAESIFRWMETQYAAGDDSMKPDEVTLCNVLNAYANNAPDGGAARAQDIVDHIESTSSRTARRDDLLTVKHYNVLIKAWGRSKTPESVDHADRILRCLEQRYKNGEVRFKPDVTSYSSVINSAAYYAGGHDGKEKALQVALRAYQRIRSQSNELEANSIVFGTVLKAIGKLAVVGSRRDDLIRHIFVECCESGYVDSFVLSQLRFCSSMSQYRSLVFDRCGLAHHQGSLSMKQALTSMPASWTRKTS